MGDDQDGRAEFVVGAAQGGEDVLATGGVEFAGRPVDRPSIRGEGVGGEKEQVLGVSVVPGRRATGRLPDLQVGHHYRA
ncbi:hypothetical protein [Streptomyces atratus]|uniref:hypothetical protein n=1 Tax=Streptomyces atratus TaxID=1893 RepID=UPI0013005D5D|nr:hypothetical protein [Streptomyces atratus]